VRGVLATALAILLLPGCGDDLAPGGAAGPFDPQPDEAEGLTNLSADLDRLLEGGELPGACDRYRSGEAEGRRARLLCGKEMFFYESFDTAGAPAPLLDHLMASFPDEVGAGFERYGMVRDPGSPGGLPLGLAPTVPLGDGGEVPAYAFTCASCHFAELPDGRYAVGAPNHAYDYGRQVLAMAVYPSLAAGLTTAEDHAPEVVAAVQPLLDRYAEDEAVQEALYEAILAIAPLGSAPALGREVEEYYASWATGTQDFIIAPLPLDDGVHTISKIIDLWAIPDRDEMEAAGMPHAMLAWSGGAPSLGDFLAGFAIVGGQEPWSAERLAPLADYIETLRAPDNPDPPDPALVAEGEELFAADGCAGCHGGPRGSGTRLFDYDEIGTDAAMARWLDPDGDGEPCCDVELVAPLTGQLKSPRLTGMWAKRRFLHNGSLASLDEVFCLGGPRPAIDQEPYGTGGHAMTCDLPDGEKRALIAYLLAH
jgi:hypothetical protein